MVHQNSGQFAALSRRKLGSESRLYPLLAAVAQLVERRPEEPRVGGPIPPGGTNKLSIGITIGSVCHSDKVEIESSNLSLWTIGFIVLTGQNTSLSRCEVAGSNPAGSAKQEHEVTVAYETPNLRNPCSNRVVPAKTNYGLVTELARRTCLRSKRPMGMWVQLPPGLLWRITPNW